MNEMMRKKAVQTVEKLAEKKLVISTAESCTGGMVAKLITDISGSSEVFCGGIVSYANSVKENVLGVSGETLEKYGAVSENTAREMCIGSRKVCKSDIAVSTTGIAGPTGGTPEKPVGTVCFGITSDKGTRTFTMHFGEDRSRNEIRHAASAFALDLIAEEADKF